MILFVLVYECLTLTVLMIRRAMMTSDAPKSKQFMNFLASKFISLIIYYLLGEREGGEWK
jgi:hypothetical protein